MLRFFSGMRSIGPPYSAKPRSFQLVTILAMLLCSAFAQTAPSQERSLLASHYAVVMLERLDYSLCKGLTEQCPLECGDSGIFAVFKVIEYIEFESHSEFGTKLDSFRIQLTGSNYEPKENLSLAPKLLQAKIGDFAFMKWSREYVSIDSTSYPEWSIIGYEHIPDDKIESSLDGPRPNSWDKIKLELKEYSVIGVRHTKIGVVGTTYEYRIPNQSNKIAEVARIDPTAVFHETGEELTVQGSTNQCNFRSILFRLSELPYVKEIAERQTD